MTIVGILFSSTVLANADLCEKKWNEISDTKLDLELTNDNIDSYKHIIENGIVTRCGCEEEDLANAEKEKMQLEETGEAV